MADTENKNYTEGGTAMSKNGVTKPTIELEDFFSLLDPKVVEKIKQTSKENRQRIMNDVKQFESDLAGAQKIIDSLR